MSDVLQRRAKQVAQRRAVLAWEYRQRHHSKGVWFRLRRVLVDAAQAFAIDDADAAALESEGYSPLSVGHELHPKKQLFFVPDTRVTGLSSRRELAVKLGPDLLAAVHIVLVRHPE